MDLPPGVTLLAVREAIDAMARAETRADADAWLDGRRFVALIEHASDITTVLAADSTVQYMSPAAERILGYPASELIGRSNIELIHPEDRWELRRAFAASLRSGTASAPVELRFRHRDGSWRWLEVVATNRLRDPAIGGIIVNSAT
jgi:PAS domain S-box-containing protein